VVRPAEHSKEPFLRRKRKKFAQYLERQARLYLVVKEHGHVVLSRPMYGMWIPIVVFLLFAVMGEVGILGDMIWDDDPSERLLGAVLLIPVTLLLCLLLGFVRVLLRTYLWIYDGDLPPEKPRIGSCMTAGEIEKVELSLGPVSGYARGGGSALAWSIYLIFPKKATGRKIYACLASPSFLKKRQNRERARAEALARRLAERWHVQASGVRQEQAP